MAWPQYVKRSQQLLRTLFVDEVSQQHDQRSSLAVRRDEFKRMAVRRLDHLGLDSVQSLERCIDVIVSATRWQVALDPASKNHESGVVAGACRRGKERECRMNR